MTSWLDRQTSCHDQSRVLSACVNSPLCEGIEALSGVDIPVHAIPTDRAIAEMITETQRGVMAPALAAELAGRMETVRSKQGAFVAYGLVRQLTSELTPSRIADRAGQPMAPEQAIDMEILDYERLVVAHERSGERMEEGAADVADAPMQPGHAPACGLPAPAPVLPPRQSSRGAAQPLGISPQQTRRQELAAIGAGGEGAQAEIDADHGGGRRSRHRRLGGRLGDLAEEADGPAVGIRADGGGDHPTAPAQRFGAAHGADDREDDVPVAEPHGPHLEGWLIAALRFEARPARIPFEEVPEGLVEVPERLGVGARGDLAHEGILGIDAGDEVLLQLHPIGLLARLVRAVPPLEAPIVGQTGAAGGLEDERDLGRGGPQRDDMGKQRRKGSYRPMCPGQAGHCARSHTQVKEWD